MTVPAPSPRRVVLLLHEGHGVAHTDLLLERDDGPLVAFRAPVGVALLLAAGDEAQFDAEPLPAHRRVYLDYEGPISGGRGVVRRVATLALHVVTETPESLRFSVGPAGAGISGTTDWSGHPIGGGLWRFDGRGRLREPVGHSV